MGRVEQTIDLGTGEPVLLMQGFGLQPRTYLDVALLLAARCRVIVPPLFAERRGSWSPERVLERVLAELSTRGIGRVTIIGHSFGGALELELAVRRPDLVRELVFVDTLAMSREWTLAAEAVRPLGLLWMATPRAAIDFGRSVASHPLCLARAGWWGFRSDRRQQVAVVREAGIPAHVLWADRDSLLTREDGRAFATDLGADFRIVHGRDGPGRRSPPVDHDWMYRHPGLLVDELDRLGLEALAGASGPRGVLRSSDCAGD
jgi:pimeloyl-ACP methyl ester carboxylesterase